MCTLSALARPATLCYAECSLQIEDKSDTTIYTAAFFNLHCPAGVQPPNLMRPFLIRIIIECVVAVLVGLIFLAIYISRLTLPRWEPRLPEAPPCTVHHPRPPSQSPQTSSEATAPAAGTATTDDESPQPYPVLLIHGFASSPSTFHLTHCVLPLLQEGHSVALASYRPRDDGPPVGVGRVFTHSLFGCLPRSALPVSIESMAADLVVLINERGWKKVHVVGHSMGGMVAQALAIEVPEKIASLTTVGSCVGPGLGPCVPRIGRLLWDAVRVVFPAMRDQLLGEDAETEDGNIVVLDDKAIGGDSKEDAGARERKRRAENRKQARSEWGQRQLAAIITSRGRARKLDSVVRRGRLRGPIVAVSGDQDTRIAPGSSAVARRRITGCKSYVVGGMSHTPRGAEWTEVLRLAGLVRSKSNQATP